MANIIDIFTAESQQLIHYNFPELTPCFPKRVAFFMMCLIFLVDCHIYMELPLIIGFL